MVTPEGKVRSVMLSVFRAENPVKKGRAGLATIFDITKEKELDRAKTQFVSLASHQLRSPIVTVKWYVEMLLSGDLGPLNEKQLDYISRLGKVNQSMTELVETLLSISRIEIGALAIDKKRVNVPKIIDDILPELETVRKQNNVKIIRQYDGNLTDIEGDPRLLRIGKFLKDHQFDELLQFINILRGDMSFVGPRPEVPSEVETYDKETRDIILSVKPGLTDLATLEDVHEAEILKGAPDPHEAYRRLIQPGKLRLAKEYVKTRSFWLDIKIILKTIKIAII